MPTRSGEGTPSAEDITVEDLHRMADDLQHNIREQELEEERRLVQSLKDRESLIKEARGLQEKLDAAQKASGAFQLAKDQGKLSPVDLEQFKRVSSIASRLGDLVMDINDKIATIEGERTNLSKEELKDRSGALTSQEKVRDRLYDEAKKEEEKTTKKKKLAEAEKMIAAKKEELLPKLGEIVDAVVKLGRDSDIITRDRSFAEIAVREGNARIQAIIADASHRLQAGKRSIDKTANVIGETWRQPLDQVLPTIQKVLDGLWLFKGKEKEVIGRLVRELTPVIDGVNDNQKKYEGLGKQLSGLEERAVKLGERFSAILEEARTEEEKVGQVEGRYHSLDTEIKDIFRRKINEIALEKVQGRGNTYRVTERDRNYPLTSELNRDLAWAYGRTLTASQEKK